MQLLCLYQKNRVVTMCVSMPKSFIVKQMFKVQIICYISEEVNIFTTSWFNAVFSVAKDINRTAMSGDELTGWAREIMIYW